ncbi:MAG: HU family DNA-binding protein [Bacteroides sp.]|nr:HU family DNA-binding protein [Bacteroides sp.]
MSITFKKQLRKNPQDQAAAGKYYPHLVVWGKPATLDSIAASMKESSSLTEGDIKSVLTNFVKAMRSELYHGHSVNIQDFGVFGLAATSEGSDTKEECQASKIKSVRITFRASSSVRPNLAATRAEDKMDFVDLESQLKSYGLTDSGDDTTNSGTTDSGNTDTGGDSGSTDEEYPME